MFVTLLSTTLTLFVTATFASAGASAGGRGGSSFGHRAIRSPKHPNGKRAQAQVYTQCVVPKTPALTFDDGPYVYLYDVSKALVAANATGTWFFNGHNYGGCIYNEDQAKRVKYVYDRGHQVASHTWSHGHLINMTWDTLHHEFWLMEQAIQRITGAVPAFVRPPFGEHNAQVREVSGVRGQGLVLWDFDTRDWADSVATMKQRYTALAAAKPKNILALAHDVYEPTAHQIVPHAISVLQKAGYKLVTVAECLGLKPYQKTGSPGVRDASWKC